MLGRIVRSEIYVRNRLALDARGRVYLFTAAAFNYPGDIVGAVGTGVEGNSVSERVRLEDFSLGLYYSLWDLVRVFGLGVSLCLISKIRDRVFEHPVIPTAMSPDMSG